MPLFYCVQSQMGSDAYGHALPPPMVILDSYCCCESRAYSRSISLTDTGCLDPFNRAFVGVMTHLPLWFEFGGVGPQESSGSIRCRQSDINWCSFCDDNLSNFPPGPQVVEWEL